MSVGPRDTMELGPRNLFSQELHAAKYRADGESFDDYCIRYARTTADNERHFRDLLDALRQQRLLPAGRQQLAVGRAFQLTAMNCYVSDVIPDDTRGIMDACTDAAMTLRLGGGIGFDFSTIRPSGEPIRGLGIRSYSSGPVSFMEVWNAMSGTIMSAGHRRGAMMGVLRCDHPDIMKFITAKRDQTSLTNFNISVWADTEFLQAVETDGLYDLKFGGRVFGQARALDVWSAIMQNTYDHSEPGVLFDTINTENNLWYCETIAATNPCGEVPLPPNGACLLGSMNLVKYLVPTYAIGEIGIVRYEIDFDLLTRDVEMAVRAFDRVIDKTNYPLDKQAVEERTKRRMGVGITAMANALSVLGLDYASEPYLQMQDKVLTCIRDAAYRASIKLATEQGPFDLFERDKYMKGKFVERLPDDIKAGIYDHGIRNSHLLSIAPTGTISLAADNVSSGLEPPYAIEMRRLVHMPEGQREVSLNDYAFDRFLVRGKTASEISGEAHVTTLCRAQQFVDQAISKTVNCDGKAMGYQRFKDLYIQAWHEGAKGITTFNSTGKRVGIFTSDDKVGQACTIDPETGAKTCEG